MSFDDRRKLRDTFDEAADLYERARPGYPEGLFKDLIELGGLESEARVLEIGCGTGQATRSLARRGYDITCIEIGESLAAIARRGLTPYPNVRVITSPFETWGPDDSPFDVVFAATSWHWLDPDRRYVKAAAVLKSDGVLAIVTTNHVLPDDGDPFFSEIQATYNALGATREADAPGGSPPPPPDQVGNERANIEASTLFGDVKVCRYLREQSYTVEQYLALLETYSGHRSMAPAARQVLNEEIRRRIGSRPNHRVHKHYLFTLHVARRLSPAPTQAGPLSSPIGDKAG